jgi:hypothetical protein
MNSSQIEQIIGPVGGRVIALDELAKIDLNKDEILVVVNTDASDQVVV